MNEELSFSIDGIESQSRIFIDEFGGEGVWLGIHIHGAHCHMAVSFDAAREMIDALQKVLETEKKVEKSTT